MLKTQGPARAPIPTCQRRGALPTPAIIEAYVACFAFPGLHDLAAIFSPPTGKGRRADYPPICLLAVLAASQFYGGVATVLRELGALDGFGWKLCACKLEEQVEGLVLPAIVPTWEQVDTFRTTVCARLDELQSAFRSSAIGLAQHMGSLSNEAEPDWAAPNPNNTIYGDGTILKPYSNVTLWTHPGTGEVVVGGSRAKDLANARVQTIRTDTAQDGKGDRQGINHVSVHTWTDFGRVVLGTHFALGSEVWPALELVEDVQARVEGGVHTLLWDGIYDGWLVDYMMGRHCIQVINHSKVATTENPNAKDLPDAPSVVPTGARVQHRIAEEGLEPTPRLEQYTLDDELARLYESPAALPVGTCVYPRVGGTSFEVVHSQWFGLAPAIHEVNGAECVHQLVVDDGALYVVEDDPLGEFRSKIALPTCTSATARADSRGVWTRDTTWTIPCQHGDFDHLISWTPNGDRYHADTPKNERRKVARGLADLRPIARPHELFYSVYGRRNDAESYNQWYKNRLQHHGIEMHLKLEDQRLDFLMGALLNNAITYDRFNRP